MLFPLKFSFPQCFSISGLQCLYIGLKSPDFLAELQGVVLDELNISLNSPKAVFNLFDSPGIVLDGGGLYPQ